jgi:hypothetical protein
MGDVGRRAILVCVDRPSAATATAAGTDVVLVLPEGVPVALRPSGPGRLAVMVGDPTDPAALAAAAAMGAEVFGS